MLRPTAHVIGNAALDETLLVGALPAPGASVLARPGSRDLGGKGANAAVVLARAGVPVAFTAPVGADARGAEIRARLAAEGLDGRLVAVDAPSDVSVILAAGDGGNAVVTTHAAADALTAPMALAALARARAGDLLVMQNNLQPATTLAALRAARAAGLLTAFNPSPFRPGLQELWPFADAIFANEGEAATLGGAASLLDAGVGCVVVTLGERGVRMVRPEGLTEVDACPAQAVDPTGAGDCLMATALASALLREANLDARALRHGVRAAALAVGRLGTVRAFPSAAEMAAILATP